MSPLDINALAVGLGSHVYDSLVEGMSAAFSEQMSKLKVGLRTEMPQYIEAVLARTARVKTITNLDESVDLDSIYTPLSYETSGKIATDQFVINKFKNGGRILVSGTAGGGKSILIKRICVDLLRNKKSIIPLYFELRSINDLSDGDVLGALRSAISDHMPSFTEEIFLDALQRGKIGFVLDGFDEVDFDKRTSVGKQLESICQRFPKLPVAITSRPEDDLPGLSSFTVFTAQRMSKEQAVELISKLEYDPEKKVPFIENLEKDLFDNHEDFASLPLTLSMMLLTYSHYSDIPAKIYIFYQQAFDVLYQRHDRSKGVYTRKSYTNLAPDTFRSIFAFFCASTYVAEKFQLSEDETIGYIREASKFCHIDVNPNMFLMDLLESTCLLQRDGVYISYVHRSFQEYFTAVFIRSLSDKDASMMMPPIIKRVLSDSVLQMMFEMDSSFLERVWVDTTITDLLELAKGENGDLDANNLIPDVFDTVSLDVNRMTAQNATTTHGNEAMALWLIYNIYELMAAHRNPEETVNALKNVAADKNLSDELIRLSTGHELFERYTKTGKVVKGSIGGGDMFVDINLASDALRTALGTRAVLSREMNGWIQIQNDLRKRKVNEVGSLASMLKSGD